MRAPILVTGGHGFLGTHLSAELSRRGVRGARRPARQECDLLDASAVRTLVSKLRPATIFHLAGRTGISDAAALWDVHVGATVNLLEAAAALERPGDVTVVVAGSAADYGAGAAGRARVREDAPCLPLGPYGASKLSQTLAALSYRHRGLRVLVARIFNASGPGCPDKIVPGAFAAQIAAAERGEKPPVIEVGDLSPRRDFVDARDIARALADLGERRPPSGVYNVCSGKAVKISDVLSSLIALSSRKVNVRSDPRRRRAADLRSIAGDFRKIAAAAGWRPRIALEESLADTLAWYRR